MAKTSKTMPTKKAKKSTSQKTKTVRGKKKKDAIDEPSSSPPPSPPLFAVRGKKDGIDVPPDNGGVLLNPHDVDDPALTAVDPSVSAEINYDVPSPRRSPRRGQPANDKDNSNDLGIDDKVDDEYESDDSADEDYRGDIYEDDYSDGEEDLLLKYRVPSARGRGAGRKPKTGRPPKPDTKGMSEQAANAAVTAWEKKWKRNNDANRRTAAAAAALQDVDESLEPSAGDLLYTGVCTRTLREMKDVELNPLCKGDTFPNKEILMLRIVEEANLFAVRIQTRRSDLFQLQVYGAGGDPFHVHGNYRSGKSMWVVTACEVRIGRTKYVPRGVVGTLGEKDDVLSASDRMIVDLQDTAGMPRADETFGVGIFDGGGHEGNADDSDGEDDEDDDKESAPKTVTKARAKSPIKSKWLVPLVKGALAEKPNISNKALALLLSPYVVDKFLTTSLLNQTKKYLRRHLFGDPEKNITYLPQLVHELQKAGHDYEIITKSNAYVLQKLEEMILGQHIALAKASGVKPFKQDKINFIEKWRNENQALLSKEGLVQVPSDPNSFVTGIFISLSTARATVPLLQPVYQADAAHTNFGKYTLYSCYGVSSNGNTFPVCFGIVFGNEDKEGWTRFWKFATQIHPCINRPTTTVITDQQKGSIPAFAEVVPLAVNFFCSFHRRENIKKFVRGGTGTYSCMWLYNLLLNAKTPAAIDKLRFDHGAEMQDNALHFLGSIPDTQQFPAARCGMGNDICMYQRTAASSVESMNRANERVRDRTAVDPINSLILLIKLEATRFEKHKENAWNRMDELLTPHSTRLAKDAFQKVNVRDYYIEIGKEGDTYCCVVNRLTSSNKYTTRIPGYDTHGSFFGTCDCGIPRVDGFPCQHMIAVCKSGRIEGLKESNVMPYWWHTSHWRKQYPQGVSVGSNFSIEMMRNGKQDNKYKLCPAISGPNKTGRPKLDKRYKSLMEQSMEKKKKQNQAQEAKKQVSSKATTAGKGKKRKADTVTHAHSKKQVATDGTKRVSERQRKKK